MENPDTSHALQILEKSAYTESQLYAYEQFWDAVVNERVSIEGGFKKGMAKGLEEGLEEGLAKGLAEGREKGLAEGRAEGLAKGRAEEKLDNARKMKAKGYSLADIADITGLTPEEIERL